jgi:hypothetical protein
MFGSSGNFVAHSRRKCFDSPDRLKANVLFMDFFEFDAQIFSEHAHQGIDLVSGAFPILSRKRVEGQSAQPESRSGVDRRTHGLDSGPMAGDSGLSALRGPATVTVHNDGDVPG